MRRTITLGLGIAGLTAAAAAAVGGTAWAAGGTGDTPAPPSTLIVSDAATPDTGSAPVRDCPEKSGSQPSGPAETAGDTL
ncbi:hypothetical protein AB0M20_42165 [Actinoplanes sp. NPDC051633]|uniref:hypothetical protein n=1 Tax=Actinoplanes sp. NPDC051633 TaxID=3155670 RepID=UPI003449EC3F